VILPLSGITVVELGHSVAAPFAGQVLGDLGADVVKVENPQGGDDARAWGPPFWHGASATFQSLNRNKASVAVDLKDEDECGRLREFIVGHADVVLQNLRPGTVQRFGLDEGLRRRNPRLVYCNMGAFGAHGPWKDKPGYDPLMQAFGGIMSVTGEPGRPPVRVGPSIVDMGTALWAVIGVLAAIERRHRTGEGCVVDTSLFETSLAWMTVPIVTALASGRDPGRTGSEAAMIAPYKAYRARDRYVVIAAGNDALFRRLAEVMGHPEWADDARFRGNADRVAHREALNGLIEAIVSTADADDWVARLDRAGVPAAPLQAVSEVLAHAQTRAVDMVRPLPDGSMSLVSAPLSFDGERLPFRRPPPALGADAGRLSPSLAREETP
jgi:crotonobetainyl-CoA:carnitine CoA-transferase CaiB-like acyl-CoA transferase